VGIFIHLYFYLADRPPRAGELFSLLLAPFANLTDSERGLFDTRVGAALAGRAAVVAGRTGAVAFRRTVSL